MTDVFLVSASAMDAAKIETMGALLIAARVAACRTQKPIECMKRPIENNSAPGDAVYEPFSGSGTTIIAGEMTGRRVLAIELSPAYVDVAVNRWQNFTGKTAVLESTGETFAEVAERRTAVSATSALAASSAA